MEFVLVLLVCVVGANSQELFTSVKVIFDNAWNLFKTFIKRPPRYNRAQEWYGKGNNYEPEAPETVEAEEPLPKTVEAEEPLPKTVEAEEPLTVTKHKTANVKSTVPPDMLRYFQRPKHKQLLLPIIPTPKWRSKDDWYDDQNADRYMLQRERFPGSRLVMPVNTFAYTAKSGHKTTSNIMEEYDGNVGVTMFI